MNPSCELNPGRRFWPFCPSGNKNKWRFGSNRSPQEGITVNKIGLTMKLGLGFGALLLIVAILGVIGYTSINRLSDLSDEVDREMYKKQLSTDVDAGMELQTSATCGYVLSGKEATIQRRDEGMAQSDNALAELNKLLQNERAKALSVRVEAGAKELRDLQSQAIELRRAGKTKEATDVLLSAHTTQVRVDAEKTIDDMTALIETLRDAAQTTHEQIEVSTIRLTVILAIAGILIGIGVAILIVRSVHGAIARMVE